MKPLLLWLGGTLLLAALLVVMLRTGGGRAWYLALGAALIAGVIAFVLARRPR